MKKRKSTQQDERNFVVRGVSFPKDPNVIAIAEESAKKQNRNFSNYIVELILQDASKDGGQSNV